RSQGYRKLVDLQTAWRAISGSQRLLIFGGYIARRDFLDARAAFAADFARVHVQALNEYKSDRASFVNATLEVGTAGPSVSAVQPPDQATYVGYDDVGPERIAIDDQDVADYRKLLELMAKSNVLKSPPPDAAALFRQIKI